MSTSDADWTHLEARPHLWRKQLWLKGTRTQAAKAAARVKAGELLDVVATELGLPVEAVEEAVRYEVADRELIQQEADEDARLEAAAKSGGVHTACVATQGSQSAPEIGVYETYVLLGLGNPAERYAHTRHNIGWDVIDALSSKYDIPLDKGSVLATWGEGHIGESTVVLAHALTYMNDSGKAAHELVHAYAVGVGQVLVIYDDMALPLGSLRLRPSGSAGGHNGLKSVQAYLGDGYPRLRLGIAPSDPVKAADLYAFVLETFATEEQETVAALLTRAVTAVECVLANGVSKAMEPVNRKVKT